MRLFPLKLLFFLFYALPAAPEGTDTPHIEAVEFNRQNQNKGSLDGGVGVGAGGEGGV